MKKFKILICALFVLFGSMVFVACEEQPLEFSIDQIIIDATNEFTYDGTSHVVAVSYSGMDVDVDYALEADKDNFMPLSSLEIVDAGDYKVYYRLSADGYKTYTSSKPIEFKINPKAVSINVSDYVWIKGTKSLNLPYTSYESVDVQFSFGSDFDENAANYGEVYPIICSSANPNYTITSNAASMYVSDKVEVRNTHGETRYFKTLEDAIDNAVDGDVCVLNTNFKINKTIEINKSITIDGRNKWYELSAHETGFTPLKYQGLDVASIFNVNNSNVRFTLKDVNLNGNQVSRAVSAFAGTVVIDNANITNGKKVDRWRSGGVYITRSASFEMKDGKISGNNANDEEYTKYCADLWIGANANGSLVQIDKGMVGNVFVNSNSFAEYGAGKFVLNGGDIENIYVEYDSGYGARFDYVEGNIDHLKIAYKNDNTNSCGAYYEVNPTPKTIYYGGQIYINGNTEYMNSIIYNENLTELQDGKIYVFDKCTFNAPLSITNKVGLVFSSCTFTSEEDVASLYVTSATSLVVNNCKFAGNAIDVNLYSATCNNLVIVNNEFNSTSYEGASISIKARLGRTDESARKESWAEGQTQGLIDCEVQIIGNNFSELNNIINIGAHPNAGESAANKSTGAFELLVKDNLDDLTIYKKYNDKASDIANETLSKEIIESK